MPNMIVFAERAGERTFAELPFGEIDQAILTQLVHLPFEAALPNEASCATLEGLSQALSDITADKVYEVLLRDRLKLLHVCGASARYGHLVVSAFVNDISHEDEMQFSAMCVALPEGRRAICFRGTDLTLAGWKEDFNMAFDEPTPAQKRAVDYINQYASVPTIVLGHSKGGNLAVYGSAFCDPLVQCRITQVYTNDGPGLARASVESAPYQAVAERITSFLPQNSLVGVLLAHHEPYNVVYSRAIGILEHNPFSWVIEEEADMFVRREELSRTSKVMDATLDGWLENMEREERRTFVDTLYQVLAASGTKTLGELVKNPKRSAEKMLRATKDISPRARKVLRRCMASFFSTSAEVIVAKTAEALGIAADPPEGEADPPTAEELA